MGLYTPTILGGDSYLSWFYDRGTIKDPAHTGTSKGLSQTINRGPIRNFRPKYANVNVTIQSHGLTTGARTHYLTANGVRDELVPSLYLQHVNISHPWGLLMGGPQCRTSILINVSAACHFAYFIQCHMSNFGKDYVPCHYIFGPSLSHIISPIVHVEFRKFPCRPVDFRGQGPSHGPKYCCIITLSPFSLTWGRPIRGLHIGVPT